MSVELSESVINGRFQVTERPMASPGKCAVCGAVDRAVLDFGMTLDYYGAVLICLECLRSATAVVELYSGESEAHAAAQVVPLQFLDVEGLNEYVASATKSVAALNVILALNSITPVDEESSSDVQQGDSGSNSDAKGTGESSTRESQQSDDSIVGEGSSILSASSGDGQQGVFDF